MLECPDHIRLRRLLLILQIAPPTHAPIHDTRADEPRVLAAIVARGPRQDDGLLYVLPPPTALADAIDQGYLLAGLHAHLDPGYPLPITGVPTPCESPSLQLAASVPIADVNLRSCCKIPHANRFSSS